MNNKFIKGAEFEVLKQVPWEKVDIEVLMIELEHAGKVILVHDNDDDEEHPVKVIITINVYCS